MKVIIVRFAELTTKGHNRLRFQNQLIQTIHERLPHLKLAIFHDRILIETNQLDDEITFHLQHIPGIHSFSIAEQVPLDVEMIRLKSIEMASKIKKLPYKVDVKRIEKTFPLTGMELMQQIAAAIDEQFHLPVDVHHPQTTLKVEIRSEGVFLYTEVIYGLGGLPAVDLSKVLVLISGGIDSPVAAVEMIKRGMTIECLHFASPPYTTPRALQKVYDTVQQLTAYQSTITLHTFSFTSYQEAIDHLQMAPYNIVLMRRGFFKLAELVAEQNDCQALVTGESLGQVASQTLISMNVISQATKALILRPLLTWHKQAIIDQSQTIGTYPISIRPYRDCCIVFTPKEPVTKPNLARTIHLESLLPPDVINHVIHTKQSINFHFSKKENFGLTKND